MDWMWEREREEEEGGGCVYKYKQGGQGWLQRVLVTLLERPAVEEAGDRQWAGMRRLFLCSGEPGSAPGRAVHSGCGFGGWDESGLWAHRKPPEPEPPTHPFTHTATWSPCPSLSLSCPSTVPHPPPRPAPP